MARNYGRITTSIWRDPDFTGLTPTQQAAYFMLITQPEVTAAGTLPLTVRRWAKHAFGISAATLRTELDALEAAGHVVIDEDTEELLIRTFVKWDGGHTNSKRTPVVREAALGIASPKLRAALAGELMKLGLADMASQLRPDRASDSHADRASDGVTPEDRVVVTSGESVTPTPNPHPATPAPVATATRALAVITDPSSTQTIVAEWIDHCDKRPPNNVIGQASKGIAAMLAEGIDPDDVRRGVAAWMTKGLHPSTLPSVVNEVMNSGRRSSRAQDETDAMFARAAQRLGVAQ